jgi:hypothetical protein
MLPFGVTIPATVPQRSEAPDTLMNYAVYFEFSVKEQWNVKIQFTIRSRNHTRRHIRRHEQYMTHTLCHDVPFHINVSYNVDAKHCTNLTPLLVGCFQARSRCDIWSCHFKPIFRALNTTAHDTLNPLFPHQWLTTFSNPSNEFSMWPFPLETWYCFLTNRRRTGGMENGVL